MTKLFFIRFVFLFYVTNGISCFSNGESRMGIDESGNTIFPKWNFDSIPCKKRSRLPLYKRNPARRISSAPNWEMSFEVNDDNRQENKENVPRKKICRPLSNEKTPALPTASIPNSKIPFEINDDNRGERKEKRVSSEDARAHCSTCDVYFRYDAHYEKHCKERHEISSPYRCGVCRKCFGFKYALSKHLKIQHGSRKPNVTREYREEIRCECGEIAMGVVAFEKHAAAAHKGVRMVSCPRCPKKFFKRRALSIHASEHLVRLKCHFCENIFDRSDLLKNHEEFCERRQRTKKKIGNNEVWIEVNDEKTCPECGEEFAKSHLLRRHCRSVHPGLKLFFCEFCDQSFFREKTLNKHVDTRHAEEAGDLNGGKVKFEKGHVFTCEHCNAECAGINAYERHAKRHPGKAMLHCAECGKGFRRLATLHAHAKEQHGDDKTSCFHCSQCYHDRNRLKRHEDRCRKRMEKLAELRQRRDAVKYHCDICDEDLYVKKESFRSHVRRHGMYVYCALCKMGFNARKNPNSLNDHMRLRHPLRENIEALLKMAADAKCFPKEENVKLHRSD